MGYRGQAIGLMVLALGSGSCGATSDGQQSATGGVSSGGRAETGGDPNSGGTAGTFSSSGGSSGVTGGVPNQSGSGGTAAAGVSGGTPAASGSGGGGVAGSNGAGNGGATAASGAGGGVNAGTAGTAGAQTAACPEVPVARRASGTLFELPVHLTLQGKPLLFAESNPLPDGGTLTPLDIRFYISEVALLRATAEPVPVDVVNSGGTLAPYGVHLYSADDVTSNAVHLLAPPGEYVGIQFLLGLALPCNVHSPEQSSAPLSATSQMSWPHTGFLFLRYQGRTTPPGMMPASGGSGGAEPVDSTSLFPPVIHMGGSLFQELAPLVRVDGALSIPASGSFSKGLSFALDEVFKGAVTVVDLTGFVGPPGEEVLLGEQLRRNMPGLHLFTFEP